MEENIIISNLNDFIFCPRSIYFHNLYYSFDEKTYHSTDQLKGQLAHKKIDSHKYNTKKNTLEGIDIYSEELGLVGKIDLLELDTKTLIERKNKIKTIYLGYYLQIWAQYFCLIEMGYDVELLKFYSLSDNKTYLIDKPTETEKTKLKEIILQIKNFNLNDSFTQNRNKCAKCIYRELCDFYNDE